VELFASKSALVEERSFQSGPVTFVACFAFELSLFGLKQPAEPLGVREGLQVYL
jgi:hypothetical protein